MREVFKGSDHQAKERERGTILDLQSALKRREGEKITTKTAQEPQTKKERGENGRYQKQLKMPNSLCSGKVSRGDWSRFGVHQQAGVNPPSLIEQRGRKSGHWIGGGGIQQIGTNALPEEKNTEERRSKGRGHKN